MNLNEFLDKFTAYDPKIIDTFENQWDLYKNENEVPGLTRTILFDGQNKSEANVSVTFVDDQLVEGSIGFRDCQVIYVDAEYQDGYRASCEAYHVDIDGTKNVWDYGDYIPNKFVDLDDFIDAILIYADQCDMQVPRYIQEVVSIIHTPLGSNPFYKMLEDTEEVCQNYKVQYTITIDYEVKSVSMDSAESEAYEILNDDLCDFFDNDRIKLIKRAVIETLGE